MEKFQLKSLIKLKKLLFCILIMQACNNKVRVGNYFLPKDFEGNVAIIYNNEDNKTYDVYNFNIPYNGILRTAHSFSKGDFKINFYQKNKSNGYDTLYEELPSIKIDSTKNRIYFNRVLTFQTHNSDKIFTVSTFYVGKKKASDLAKDRFLFEKELEKLVVGNVSK